MVTILRLALSLALASLALPARAQDKPWRHGIIDPKSDSGFSTMITKGGFAEKNGLKVELVNFPNDSIAVRALLAGELESYEGGPGSSLVAAARNADVKIVGCQWLTVVHSIFSKKDINNAADLRGTAMAISAPGSMPDLIAKAYLARENVAVADVRFANLGNDGERYKSLLGGVTSSAVVSNEFVPIAEPAGLKLLVRGRDVVPNFIRLCMMSSGRALSERRADAVRFLTAQMQALRFALANPNEETRVTREVTGIKPDDPRPEYIFKEGAMANGVDPSLPIPLDRLEWMQGALVKAGNMAQTIDLKKIVNGDIRAEALGRAGIN